MSHFAEGTCAVVYLFLVSQHQCMEYVASLCYFGNQLNLSQMFDDSLPQAVLALSGIPSSTHFEQYALFFVAPAMLDPANWTVTW